jgi:hypothetical protein
MKKETTELVTNLKYKMQKEINSLRMSLDYKTEEFNKFKMKASIELELGR